MATRYFLRSRRLLQSDSARSPLVWIACVLIILGMWGIWFFTGEVGVWVQSTQATLSVSASVIPLQIPVTDRISSVHIQLGDTVHRHDTLVVLEYDVLQGELLREQEHRAQIEQGLLSNERRMHAQQQSMRTARQADSSQLREEQKNYEEAVERAELAASEARRLAQAGTSGSVPQIELERAQSEARTATHRVDVLREKIARTEREQHTREQKERAAIEELQGVSASLKAEVALAESRIIDLRDQIQQRILLSPIDGVVGSLAEIAPGTLLQSGSAFGSIVPEGTLAVVAHFDPATTPGRVRTGQEATISFPGFSRVQYGTLRGKVATVAREPEEQGWRVELDLLPGSAHSIPLQHGLEGSVEICVEYVSPADMLLRLVGGKLQG